MRYFSVLACSCLAIGGFALVGPQESLSREVSFDGSAQRLASTRLSHMRAILQEITDAKAAKRDPSESAWLDQLGTLYSAHVGDAIWTGDRGYNARGREVIGELQNAHEWGLKPADYAVPRSAFDILTNAERAKLEVGLSLSVIKYAWHARGGRIQPRDLSLWLDREIEPVDGFEIIKTLATTTDVTASFKTFHPQHPEFERLRQAYLALRDPSSHAPKAAERILVPARGPSIRPGDSHRDVSIIRERLKVPAKNVHPEAYTPDVVAAVNAFMRTQGWKRKRILDNRVRSALNKPKRKSKPLSTKAKESLLLVNIEKWRWMPRELGELHIWNNLPTFNTKVVKNNQVIHSERIIIGKADTQTPVFSDEMTHIVFKPEWGVPNSIKIRSLLPRLASGDHGVLRRRGMAIKYDDGTIRSPHRINWSRTDIRNVPIVMGPGSSNPLGHVKFIFPNEHAVYMHDTPKRHLFKNRTRTFSHGCIRVRDPVRLAEVLLDETSGWSPQQVNSQFKRRAARNNKIPLPSPIPVHNVYFTAAVDDETGKLVQIKDIYGHDRRILAALNGKPAALIAKSDPARAQKRKNEQLAKSPARFRYASTPKPTLFPGAMALGAGLPPTTFNGWGKPKKSDAWKVAKPKKYSNRKRRRSRGPRWTNPLALSY